MLVAALRQANQALTELAASADIIQGQRIQLDIRVGRDDLADRLDRQLEDRLLTRLRDRIK